MKMMTSAPDRESETSSIACPYPVVLCGTVRLLLESLAEIIRRESDFQLMGVIDSLCHLPATVDADKCIILTVEAPQHDRPEDSPDSPQGRTLPLRTVQLLLSDRHQSLAAALRQQAAGYVTLNDAIQEFLDVLRQVAEGRRAISSSLHPHMDWDGESRMYVLKSNRIFQSLNQRQFEILGRIARGDSVKEVARDMRLSEKTVDSHKYRIMQKLGLNDRVQITRLAIREGLLIP